MSPSLESDNSPKGRIQNHFAHPSVWRTVLCNFACIVNVNWPDAISLEHFQRMMFLITTAASKPAQEAIWTEQGAYLQTEEGKTYLTDIYKRRVSLRKKMEPHRWRLNP